MNTKAMHSNDTLISKHGHRNVHIEQDPVLLQAVSAMELKYKTTKEMSGKCRIKDIVNNDFTRFMNIVMSTACQHPQVKLYKTVLQVISS
jgi:hypothetical protein